MMKQAVSYDEPVERLKPLLGTTFEREFSALSELCGLIRAGRPKKIVKVGGANGAATAAVLSCVHTLKLFCEVDIVDARCESGLYTREIFDLTKCFEQGAVSLGRFFDGRTLAACTGEIGPGIDMLILDFTERMPQDILDFIAALPYLMADAVVVLCNPFHVASDRNILFQNVTADKSEQTNASLEPRSCIPYGTVASVSAFQLTDRTSPHIGDLVAALGCPWLHIPPWRHLLEYAAYIKTHYDPEYIEYYRQAVISADKNKELLVSMAQSLLETFPNILLYGKGKRGGCFLELSEWLGIHVTGFVVSDGREAECSYRGLPVYPYSQIPFAKEETFLFQTAKSDSIERLLAESGYCWMKLPERFWMENFGL